MSARHVMLDLETWGTRPGSALRSIGAIFFEPAGEVGGSFYRNISRASCTTVGLEVDAATEEWWRKQSAQARDALDLDQQPLPRVVEEFHGWCREGGATFVWSQGANFDEPLWQAAARAVNARAPWKYWNVFCTRTFYRAADFDPRTIKRDGSHHNALDDALFQVRCVQESYRRIFDRVHAASPPLPKPAEQPAQNLTGRNINDVLLGQHSPEAPPA